MYRELLRQNRSRELVADFLDQFITRHGWWAARAAWVSEEGMVVEPWRVNPSAPRALDALPHLQNPAQPIDPGAARFPDPILVGVADVQCTRGATSAFDTAGVTQLTVVDVAGMLDFDVRLVFAAPPEHAAAPEVLEALRTSAALLPTVFRQEVEREELRFGSMHDPMTRLLNRSGLEELAQRVPAGTQARAVIYIDLDGFKEVNDSHGHAAGDHLIVETARHLQRLVRPTDLVGRVGGDEFVVVATSVLDEMAAVTLAQRLVAALSRDTVVASGAVASIAASGGVAVWPPEMSFADAVASADALMYEAKRIGGGIAVQDATGRVLVRDPLGGDAEPEEVERGRAAVLAAAVLEVLGDEMWGGHLLLRGELCTEPIDHSISLIEASLAPLVDRGSMSRLVIEPRGRGWSREGLLLDLVERLLAHYPGTELLLMVDSQPSSVELRLVVEEIRARLGVGLVLGGIGAASGGDVRMIAQTSPDALALDRETALNLGRTQPPGIAAILAGALAQALGAALIMPAMPSSLEPHRLADWGLNLAITPIADPHPEKRNA
ncbi:GGDEF domain-containing protein [Microcella sp.]|uniref:GGDEF domain-containing protein n=1 Tax=Microcella sp. TaxID=1913979 RepID=UPI00255D9429|nr:GGDEF domain-containing protein [Microcella sp.]MBX9472893.1 GGDEF domain-containing protein [Microcella sp.]